MTVFSRTFVLIILLTAGAGALGGWAGVQYALFASPAHSGLDELVHGKLALSGAQEKSIEDIEKVFAGRRKSLEAEMRAANRDLAAAIRAEAEFGPRAQKAIGRFHHAESELQQETIRHILAMRRVLTPEQTKKFDQEVSRALTAE